MMLPCVFAAAGVCPALTPRRLWTFLQTQCSRDSNDEALSSGKTIFL